MPTTVTTVSTGARVTQRTTHHDLSLHGRAGAILILILLCFLTFLISFTTSGWKTRLSDSCGTHRGLWEQCQAISSSYGYHLTTQILMSLALVGVVVIVILVFLYLFATGISKYQVLLGLVITSFITFTLLLIAVIVFGVNVSYLGWSYGVACVSTILCLAAAIVAAMQLHNSLH
ncbi:hypothetical protein EB796_015672 [Bugula neritina]|uniref:Uncharacterized protein n=1 Tax=Bugula neritina TaxID=10212 RepID=A0A7J7JJN3_BUGNE|nr:hypothetical protein EB796_015672 [Bugula neritina]